LYTAAARAVHFNDTNLAKFILDRHAGAELVIQIISGKVELVDEAKFSENMDKIKTEHIEKSRKQVEDEFRDLPNNKSNKKKKASRIQSLNRFSKMWIPINRALILSGVQSSGGILRGTQKDDALIEGWKPTFSKKDTDHEKTDNFLSTHAVPFDWQLVPNIDLLSFVNFLLYISHSAPGPDGIPSLAWRLAGEKGARALYNLFLWLSAGNKPSGFFGGFDGFPPQRY
jgi:hypothetical protein